MQPSLSQPSLIQSAMHYGMFFGMFLLFRFVINVFAVNTIVLTLVVLLLTFMIPILAYVFATKYKKSLPDLTISFRQVYMFVFFLFLFASLILAITQFIFYQYISPGFLEEQYRILLENSEILAKELPQTKSFFDEFQQQGVPSAIAVASQSIWVYTFFGMIIGVILGFIVRTKKN